MYKYKLSNAIFYFVTRVNEGTATLSHYNAIKTDVYDAYNNDLIDNESRKDIERQLKFLWINRDRAKTLSEVIQHLHKAA